MPAFFLISYIQIYVLPLSILTFCFNLILSSIYPYLLASNMSQNPAEDGDIELVVGDQKKHIRVYSFLMKMVSKPFNALLGPNFKEGQASSPAGQPKEIDLPDDDASAMETICFVIHHRADNLYDRGCSTTPADLLLKVATLADKYDCTAAIRGYAKSWVRHNGTARSTTKELVHTLTAAYIFDDCHGFTESSKALIKHHHGPFDGILDGMAGLKVPHAFFSECCRRAAEDSCVG